MLYLDYSRGPGQWTPNALGGRENLDAVSFLREVNATCYKRVPGIMMIAEESTAWPGVTRPVHLGGLGFGFKWNLGWMHDTLAYLSRDPVFRHYHQNEITFSMMYAFSENFVLPLSHDEVVHGKGSLLSKMPGDNWRRFAGLRALLAYQWGHPGKQLLFMGSEFGQEAEWSEQAGLDWAALADGEDPAAPGFHSGVQRLVRDLNQAYRDHPALWRHDFSPDGFSWIDASDTGGNVLSFLRLAGPGPLPPRPVPRARCRRARCRRDRCRRDRCRRDRCRRDRCRRARCRRARCRRACCCRVRRRRLRGELLRRPASRVPDRAARGGPVARGDQHRRRRVRRQRRRQLRRRRGRRGTLARPARLGHAVPAAAGRAVARARGLTLAPEA